jgi:predicted dehydrogenase
VVGAGVMGTNHARVSSQLRGAQLVAVVDQDLDRAAAAARSGGARPARTLDEVIDDIDLAIVAVPTKAHAETARQLARRGVDMLIEKPLALTSDDAQQIIDVARENDVLLAVGHIERFNAAAGELLGLLDRPVHVEASRISPFSARIPDGVIFDLMIHDLDIVQWLAGPESVPVHVSGVARSVRGETEDLATAVVTFSSGLTATFNTSRLGQQKVRTVEITQAESVITADLVRQDLTIHRMTHHEYLTDEGTRYRQSSVVEIPFIEQRGEPLLRELQHFVDCAINGTEPLVGGSDGLRALLLAERVADAVHRS